jgi:hypothetical protein
LAPTRRCRSPSATTGTIPACYSTVDRLLSSICLTLHDLIDDQDLGLLCPSVHLLDHVERGHVAADDAFAALIRLHVGLDPVDGRPLRRSPGWTIGRLIELAAGAGTVSISPGHVAGVLRPTPARSGISFRIAREDVECLVVDRPAKVQLLAPRRFGAVTLQLLGGALDRAVRAFDVAGFPAPTS